MVVGAPRLVALFCLGVLALPLASAGPIGRLEATALQAQAEATAPVWPLIPPDVYDAYVGATSPHAWAQEWAWTLVHGPLDDVDAALEGMPVLECPEEPSLPPDCAVDTSPEGDYFGFGEVAEDLVNIPYQYVREAEGDPTDRPSSSRARIDVAARWSSVCGLHSNGIVYCTNTATAHKWGDAHGDVVALEIGGAGGDDICILRAGGTVECLSEGEGVLHSVTADAVALGAGWLCYVRSDATASCEGKEDTKGDVVQVVGAYSTACFRTVGLNVRCREGSATWTYDEGDALDVHVYWKDGPHFCILRSAGDVLCSVPWGSPARTYVFDQPGRTTGIDGTADSVCLVSDAPNQVCRGIAETYYTCEPSSPPLGTEPCAAFGFPRPNPFPDLEVVDFSHGGAHSCWVYADGRSYCDNEPAGTRGRPDRLGISSEDPCVDESGARSSCWG